MKPNWNNTHIWDMYLNHPVPYCQCLFYIYWLSSFTWKWVNHPWRVCWQYNNFHISSYDMTLYSISIILAIWLDRISIHIHISSLSLIFMSEYNIQNIHFQYHSTLIIVFVSSSVILFERLVDWMDNRSYGVLRKSPLRFCGFTSNFEG